jgi:lipoprotein-anchoring transpeptidase ErfK/SrfK
MFRSMSAPQQLQWELQRDKDEHTTQIHELTLPTGPLRRLSDGSELICTRGLQLAGAVIDTQSVGRLTIRRGFHRFKLITSPKKVEINLAKQQLRAWQGDRLVLQCRVSAGRNGRTPAGNFTAGPFRARMHYSSLYHNAPMPWSVQIYGHVFIHGFTSVPNYPASHGSIRLPLNEGNPARFFYEWIDNGSPVRVVRN